jgi:hypothetical protein
MLILGKIYIWNCRKTKLIPVFTLFKNFLQRKCEIEKYIAIKTKTLEQFHKRWCFKL